MKTVTTFVTIVIATMGIMHLQAQGAPLVGKWIVERGIWVQNYNYEEGANFLSLAGPDGNAPMIKMLPAKLTQVVYMGTPGQYENTYEEVALYLYWSGPWTERPAPPKAKSHYRVWFDSMLMKLHTPAILTGPMDVSFELTGTGKVMGAGMEFQAEVTIAGSGSMWRDFSGAGNLDSLTVEITSIRSEVPLDAAEVPYVLVNGVTTPVYDYAAAIRESVRVQVPDFNGCGEPLLVAADIIRPRELDGIAKVPVIMVASPYYLCLGRGNESEVKQYDANGNPTRFPLFYDNYFVPRGYAVMAVDMAGTARSTGCSDEGAASDILSIKAVVDWLSGRATAVDRNGDLVVAAWSDGTVGMIGKSYDGTLANGVAAMGVPGLKTIVPIGAISSWYDYDRYQNLPFSYNYPSYLSDYVAGSRTIPTDCSPCFATLDATDGDETGAYTDFWAARDYREGPITAASQVKASVFIVHGLQDDNVKTPNFARWWKALGDYHVERKLWLTRVGHVDPFDSDRGFWVQTLHRWFDHQLLGIDNGIDTEPAVRAEIAPGQWVEARDWPVREHEARLTPQANGRLVLGPGAKQSLSWVNNPTQTEATAITGGDNPNRLLFTTGFLTRALRISGAPQFQLEVTHAAPTGQIGVELVDYGDAERVLSEGEGVLTTDTQSCWGASTDTDDACYFDVARRMGHTPLQVLSRGWARLDHPGTHRLTIDMIPNDIIVPAGHQLGLAIVGAAPEWVVTVDAAATTYVLDLRGCWLRLPMVGPVADFRPGAGRLPLRAQLPPGTLADPHTATRIPE